jgi:hypothetical protein
MIYRKGLCTAESAENAEIASILCGENAFCSLRVLGVKRVLAVGTFVYAQRLTIR